MRDELGSSIELTVEGKSYELRPMTIGTLSDIEAKIVSNKINIVKESFKDNTEIMKELVFDILNTKIKETEIDHFLSTLGGIKYLLRKSLSDKVSDEEVEEILKAENLSTIVMALTNVTKVEAKKKSTKKR